MKNKKSILCACAIVICALSPALASIYREFLESVMLYSQLTDTFMFTITLSIISSAWMIFLYGMKK